MPEHPRARETAVLSQPLGDELLVFDSAANRAHSLNATAAAVWRACDGTRSLGEIAEHCQIDGAAVDLALQDLADANLLADYTPPSARVSRRTAIRRLALTGASVGIALPVIRSIVAPSAAMAASGRSGNQVKGKAGEPCSRGINSTGASCSSSISYCVSGTCQRHYSASCSQTSSCIHSAGGADTCHNGQCLFTCSSGNPCPSGYSCRAGSFGTACYTAGRQLRAARPKGLPLAFGKKRSG